MYCHTDRCLLEVHVGACVNISANILVQLAAILHCFKSKIMTDICIYIYRSTGVIYHLYTGFKSEEMGALHGIETLSFHSSNFLNAVSVVFNRIALCEKLNPTQLNNGGADIPMARSAEVGASCSCSCSWGT